jgi:DNA-binding CsgD family transcriptional regulator
VLYGRQRELTRLRDLIDGVAGSGAALVIRGEAGVGKSALLAQAAAWGSQRGLIIQTATGVQAEARLPFAGLHQLLHPFLDRLGQLPGSQRHALETAFGLADRAGEAVPDLFLIALAALGLVADAATSAPLMLLVEDAQWLDAPSREVLGFIGRRLAVEPVVLLIAARDEASGLGLPEWRLGPLADGAAAGLLSAGSPELPADLRSRVLREAAGNPLALIELPKALGSRLAPLDPLPLTARLEEAFAARLSGCPAETRMLLLVTALDGGGETDDLLRAAGLALGHHVDAAAFGPAVEAGLCSVERGRVRFWHPLVRSAVQQAASAADRRRGHAALAKVRADQPDLSVWHRAGAAAEPDEAVAADLEDLASRAERRGGSDLACAALELAVSLTADPVRRGRRLARAVRLARELGRRDLCQRLGRQAERLPLDAYDRAMVAFTLEVIGGHFAGRAAVRAFLRVATDLAAAGDRRRTLATVNEAALLAYFANAGEDDRRRLIALATEATESRDDADFLHILALADPVGQGRAVIERLGSRRRSAPSELHMAGSAASTVWADEVALPLLRTASEAYRAAGQLERLVTVRTFEAWAHARRGEIRAAYTAASEAAGLTAETGQPNYLASVNAVLSIVAGERGEPNASELAAEAEAHFLAVGAHPMLSLVELARGRTALASERFSAAFDHLARLFDPGDLAYHPQVCSWALADLADAAVYGERDLGAVRVLLDQWEAVASQVGSEYLRALLAYGRALLSDEDQFAAALAVAPGWPAHRARVQLAYGTWLRRRRRSAESRAPLREAVNTLSALGLLRLADRARRELRASGETVRQRQPEAWDQLTAQELQIAQLAAQGLSNREIGERLYLSHRTVGFHLYKIFPKLGVTSRAELRDLPG